MRASGSAQPRRSASPRSARLAGSRVVEWGQMWWQSVLVLCLALAVGERDARAQLTRTKSTTPYAGIVHEVWTDPSVPLKLHLVRADVTSKEIHLQATQSGERGQTVSDWAD